ncbi:F0F1 ATP synthase subunit I [Salinicola endophyticus]|uniref:F0F1 ATP synthase subunit I n=1 Tax=Salinicola endophyticus TaxID=1949083 RepID=A0AB74UDU1_9GAMM
MRTFRDRFSRRTPQIGAGSVDAAWPLLYNPPRFARRTPNAATTKYAFRINGETDAMQSRAPARLPRPRIAAMILVQFGGVMGMALIAWGVLGQGVALSLLCGGLVAAVPSAFFAWRAFRYQGAGQARYIVKSFYHAEAGKFGLTAALFTLVFVAVPPSNPAFFFGAYVLTLLLQWLGPWLLRRPSHIQSRG